MALLPWPSLLSSSKGLGQWRQSQSGSSCRHGDAHDGPKEVRRRSSKACRSMVDSRGPGWLARQIADSELACVTKHD